MMEPDENIDFPNLDAKAGDKPVPDLEQDPTVQTTKQAKGVRQAWNKRDGDASRKAHDAAEKTSLIEQAPEKHGGSGSEYIKSIVFGGLDGIVTTFAIVATAAGASLSIKFILLAGFSNLIADAIAMGFGDYLSEKAEIDYTTSEYKRETWELENAPEGEAAEMIEIYKKKGMSDVDARELIGILTQYKDSFLKIMMVEELGMMPPDPDANPLMNGLVTFLSFMICGSIPLWAYVILEGAGVSDKDVLFGIAVVATALTIFTLGAVRGKMSHLSWWQAGFSMLLNGTIANLIAYFLGYGLEKAFGISDQSN